MAGETPRKRDSDVIRDIIKRDYPHVAKSEEESLDQYRMEVLEGEVKELKETIRGLEASINDMKIWRGYVIGAAATAGVLAGFVFALLERLLWKKE